MTSLTSSRFASASTSAAPINPAAPVTRTFMPRLSQTVLKSRVQKEDAMTRLAKSLATAATTIGVACAALPAFSQAYPSKPVHVIVPFAAGGPADIYARFVGQKL